jgi:hypothetical protein
LRPESPRKITSEPFVIFIKDVLAEPVVIVAVSVDVLGKKSNALTTTVSPLATVVAPVFPEMEYPYSVVVTVAAVANAEVQIIKNNAIKQNTFFMVMLLLVFNFIQVRDSMPDKISLQSSYPLQNSLVPVPSLSGSTRHKTVLNRKIVPY